MNTSQDILKRFHNALPESATGGSDVTDIYVNRSPDAAHDPVANMLQAFTWAESSRSYLFSGLRGAGKTTELNRLIEELNSNGAVAFYCDASAYLNLNDPSVTLSELIMTALAGLSDGVRARFGKNFLKDSIWDRTKRAMNSNVLLKPTVKAEGAGWGVEIEASLHENPDFKKALIEFSRQSSDFFTEAHKFSDEVVQLIKARENVDKVVLVVDSLERLSAPTGEEATLFDSLKALFFNDPTRLHFPSLSVIYTAPPYLHAVLPSVSAGFTGTFSLPNFKVFPQPKPGDSGSARDEAGINKLTEIVTRRFPDWAEVLAPVIVAELAWMSGGNVRRFFYLLKNTLRKAGLSNSPLPLAQIDAPPVQQALGDVASELQWLNARDRVWLKRFMDPNDVVAANIENLAEDLPSIIRLFDHSLVLNYQNGIAWYQVPPLVRKHVAT